MHNQKGQVKTILIVILAILAVGLASYLGWVLYQQKQEVKVEVEKPEAKEEVGVEELVVEEVEKVEVEKPEAKEETVPEKKISKLCTEPPVITEIGSEKYPIDVEKYGDISFLGELFTADDCGPERLSKIWGVENNNYTLGSSIVLKNNPSAELLSILQEISFEPGNACINVENTKCREWTLEKTVPAEDILKLKPFANQIESSDCIYCG